MIAHFQPMLDYEVFHHKARISNQLYSRTHDNLIRIGQRDQILTGSLSQDGADASIRSSPPLSHSLYPIRSCNK